MISLLRQRRSIRQFLDQPIEAEKIEILKEAALRAPSSRNRNPWEFYFITDPNLLDRLSRAKPRGSAFLNRAPLGIVVVGMPQESDAWIEDTSIASIVLQLTAQSQGLGSCWIQIRMRDHDENKSADAYVKSVLGIPEEHAVESIIAVGYPGEAKENIPATTLQTEKIK